MSTSGHRQAVPLTARTRGTFKGSGRPQWCLWGPWAAPPMCPGGLQWHGRCLPRKTLVLWKTMATNQRLARKVMTILYMKLRLRPSKELVQPTLQAQLVCLKVSSAQAPPGPLGHGPG